MKILDDIYTEFDQESYDETLRNDGRIEGIQIGARETAIANAKNFLLETDLPPEKNCSMLQSPAGASSCS